MINNLLLTYPVETQKVLKKAISANRALARFNGVSMVSRTDKE